MEWNGMHFSRDLAYKHRVSLSLEQEVLNTKCTSFMEKLLPEDMNAEVNPASAQQLSAILFGGEVSCTELVDVLDSDGKPIIFKSGLKKGKVKTKKKKVMRKVGMPFHIPKHISKKGKSGVYSTNDEVLNKIIAYSDDAIVKNFVSDILNIRYLDKAISTYYDGYSKFAWDEGLIHPNYNQCGTNTGRLSCDKPNLQNLSNKGKE
jgi:hypothetical protein